MYNNNKFNFGLTMTAKIIRVSDEKVIREIDIEVEQYPNENASFVGTGIASGGRNLVVYTFEKMDDVEPYIYQLEIDGVKHLITSKQKSVLQKPKRYGFKKSKQQTILTLE